MNVFVISAFLALCVASGFAANPGPCEFVCPMSLLPVCGTNGDTYASECDLKRADCLSRGLVPIKVAYYGECRPECEEVVCNKSLIPVCSVDGRYFPDNCALRRAECGEGRTIPISHIGEC